MSDGWYLWLEWNGKSLLSEARGTALYLRDDGSAARVVVRDDEGDSILEIMHRDGEKRC